MKNEELKKLIKKGESETVEFKENFDKETIETAVAFANTKGGVILIGLSDKSKIKGIQVEKETRKNWANQISQSEVHIHSIGTSWDAFPAQDKTLDDIDLKRVEKYIKEANATGRRKIKDSPTEVLKKLEFIKDGKAT